MAFDGKKLDEIAQEKLADDGLPNHALAQRAFICGWAAAVEYIEAEQVYVRQEFDSNMKLDRLWDAGQQEG